MMQQELTQEELVLAGLDGKLGNANMDGVKKLLANESSAHKYRRQFLERLPSMPEEIVKKLLTGKMQLVDQTFYKTEAFTGSSLDVFNEDDDIKTGESNVAKSRLEKNRPFVLSAIQLLYATDAADAVANFESVEYPAALKRGEVNFRYDSKDVLDKLPIIGSFDPGLEDYDTYKPYGLYELTNPKVMLDERIEFIIRLLGGQTLGADTHAVKVLLIGTTVRPF